MKNRAGDKKNWSTLLICLFLLTVLTSTQMVCGVYARYAVTGSGSDSARVAAFVFETRDKENSSYLDLSRIQKPGDVESYGFIISNQSGSAISEVAERVRFTVQLNGSMPLVCTISKEGEAAPALTAQITENTAQLPVKQTADAGVLPASTAHTESYILTVKWPENENNVKYASRSAAAELLLTVTAEQID